MFVRDQLFSMEYIVTADTDRESLPAVEGPLDILVNLGCPMQLESASQCTLLPGGWFLLLPEDSIFNIKNAANLQYLYLKVSSDFLETQNLHIPAHLISMFPHWAGEKKVSERGLQYIHDLADKMIQEFQADSQAYIAFRYSWLSEILMNLFQDLVMNEREAADTGIIPEIIRFLELNFLKKISVDMLASKFYVSKYHLMRQFKKETGYTIHNFILNKRIDHACYLIEKNISPSEACYLSGFTDYSLFFRAFTKVTGSCPSQYQFTPPWNPPGLGPESAGTGSGGSFTASIHSNRNYSSLFTLHRSPSFRCAYPPHPQTKQSCRVRR